MTINPDRKQIKEKRLNVFMNTYLLCGIDVFPLLLRRAAAASIKFRLSPPLPQTGVVAQTEIRFVSDHPGRFAATPSRGGE
jgi:hypothetical protein